MKTAEAGPVHKSISPSGVHFATNDLALAYNALPVAELPPIATKPVRFSALRAAFTASFQALSPDLAKRDLERADRALDTIFPSLFLMSLAFVRPVAVFTLRPLNTCALAILPLAMALTFFAFMAFMAFIAFAAFMAF